MKYTLLLIKLLIFSVVNAQNQDVFFVKDVQVAIETPTQKRINDATVKFRTGKKVYTAKLIGETKYKGFIPFYRFDSLPGIEGTLEVSHKDYENQSRKVIPIESGWHNRYYGWQYDFTLGKPGDTYTVYDGGLHPYTPDHFFWSIGYWQNDYDSIVDYLHQNGFMVLRHYEKVRTLIIYPYKDRSENYKILPGQDPNVYEIPEILNKQSRAEQYETLIKFKLIRVIGPMVKHELYGQRYLSNYITLEFVKYTKPEEKQMLYDKYNLELYKKGAGSYQYVRVLKNGHKINEIAIKLMNEPKVQYISTSFGSFKEPQPD